jgi:cellulose synthase/poly-beta-1,6-N-acetylglucosamine synthase-like glycosyltransferase
MSEVMLILAIGLVAFDFQNLLSWWGGRTITPRAESSDDFTIIVPLFGHPRYFDRRAQLLRYQPNVLVALEIGTPLMAAFADELESEGWRVNRILIESPNPALLVRACLPAVTTTYTLRLDADTSVGDDIAQAVAAVEAAGADLCSIKCAVANRTNAVTKFQALEYRMAMLARHFRPWLTSGACFLGRTDALIRIMNLHSLWTPGEDIETGRTALALRMRIRHLDIVVETDVPDTWPALFRQRRLWWAGTFRHWWINMDRNLLQLPVITSYYLAAIWVSLYFKWWTLISLHGLIYTMPIVIVSYVVVTAISNTQVLSPWMLVFPFYSLAQVLVMPPIGAAYYFVVAWRRRRLGRYGFGLRRLRIAPVELETRLAPWVKLEHRRIASYGLGEQGRPV